MKRYHLELREEKEWKGLDKYEVFDWTEVQEWNEVARKARAEQREIHMGRVFGFTVVKHSELDPKFWKYKHRVVFQGNRVVTQNWTTACFQDLGSNPATLDAAKACDAYAVCRWRCSSRRACRCA